MPWLQKIQTQPQAVKLKIIWTVAISVGILLIVVWIISSRFHKNVAGDTTLFKAIGQGLKDVKQNYGK